ncbi:MAG: hypothetical protein CL927_09815 [Deltaproteobacteria bacterium]|nr:hypothetical protein [Deltaproteobacteria bacterium]HCH66002.1 hypothetical protein [Deltaproteobacteria bacterium]
MTAESLLEHHRVAGASTDARDGVALATTYPEALSVPLEANAVAVVDLSHRPVFRLVGSDVRRWTNGMFTNNTRRLRPGQGNRHCACDDRGRVRGVLDLYFLAEDTVRIVLDGMLFDDFEQRYQMYLLLDDIEVEPEAFALLTVQGSGAEGTLTELGLPVPEGSHTHENAAAPWTGVVVSRRDRLGQSGFDLLVPPEQSVRLWSALTAAGAVAMGVDDLRALEVVAGRASYPTDATDKSMVHELRLNTDCCAFDKGCYVGQEVINRIDVRGAIQKRFTTVILDSPVAVGAAVKLDGRSIGTITGRATYRGQEWGAGVLRKSAWADGTEVNVIGADGSIVVGRVVESPQV